MTDGPHLTIAGVEMFPRLESIDLTPAGPRVVGTATLGLSKLGGGLTIADKAEVKMWYEASGVVTKRWFGGFVNVVDTGSEGTDKLWTVECQDYNLLLDTFIADGTYNSRIWDHGTTTFEDQIDYILRYMTTNSNASSTIALNCAVTGSMGGSAPTVGFSGGGGTGATASVVVSGGAVTALTITNPGTGYTSAPTVTISGGTGSGATATAAVNNGVITSLTVTAGGSGYYVAGFSHQGVSLRDILTERCAAYHAKNPTIKPAFRMSPGTTGAIAPQLEVYDAALAASPSYHYTDNVVGGTDRAWYGQYTRKIAGERTATRVQAKAIIGTGAGASLAVATALSEGGNRTAHPNPYDVRVIGGLTQNAWQDPIIDAKGAQSQAEVQAVADAYLAAREYARESIEFDVLEELLPGAVVQHTNSLEGLSAVNYRVAGVRYDFTEYPTEMTVRVTLGAIPLELGEQDDDDVLPAPVENDTVGPEPVTGLTEVFNVYDEATRVARVKVSFTQSVSRDIAFNTASLEQAGGPILQYNLGLSTSHIFEMRPGLHYTLTVVGTDTHGNEGGVSAALEGDAAASPLPSQLQNPDFAILAEGSGSLPKNWTDLSIFPASAKVGSTVLIRGPHTLELDVTSTLFDAGVRSDKVAVNIPSTQTIGDSYGVLSRDMYYSPAVTGVLTITVNWYKQDGSSNGSVTVFSGTPVYDGPLLAQIIETTLYPPTLTHSMDKVINYHKVGANNTVYMGGGILEEKIIASNNALGNVKVGGGLKVASDGALAVTFAGLVKYGVIN